VQVHVPSRDEQRAIAEVLRALDDKIAANTRIAATAEGLALGIASRWPSTVPVEEIALLARRTVKPEAVESPRVAHYSLPAYDAHHAPEVEPPSSIQSSKFAVERPSVLISKLNPRFPRVWNLPSLRPEPALASTEFVVLEPRFSSTSVLWSLLAQPRLGSALEELVSGTSSSHQRVKPADILAVMVADPRAVPESEQVQVESLVLRAEAARAENRTMSSTRDALLPALMSGTLSVGEARETLVDQEKLRASSGASS
jgi:type I restriction enzyme S subunit